MRKIKLFIVALLLLVGFIWLLMGQLSPQRKLVSAIMEGDVARLDVLLRADPRLASRYIANQTTPIHYAAMSKYDVPEVVDALVAGGANPNAVDSIQEQTPLLIAARRGHLAVMKALLRHGANPDAFNSFGSTALHMGASNGSADVARIWLDNGASVNLASKSKSRHTALHYAARSGNIDVINLLLKAGADVNASSSDGTPLQVAVKHKNKAAEKLLTSVQKP